jgi:hypothetical protein
MEEIWKPVVGYEGLYEVSNLGRIKSIKFGKERIMKQNINSYGYCKVNLSRNGNYKTYSVHRLVLIAFRGCLDVNKICDHINRIRTDNRIDNLRWASYSENNLNSKIHGKSKYKGVSFFMKKYKCKNGSICLYKRIVAQITVDKQKIKLGYFKTEEEAHEAYKQAFLKYRGYEWVG